MFWNKKIEKVKCETCKHYIDKTDAQEVANFGYVFGGYVSFYCPMHKLPYDGKDNSNNSVKFYKTIPEHQERVNEDGTPYKEKLAK